METGLYESLSYWELDLGLPEGTFTDGLLGNDHKDVRREELLEGDSLWKDTDFPLKEASKKKVINDRLDTHNFDLEEDLIENDWLDEKINLGVELDDFIDISEFEAVINNLSGPVDFLEVMDNLPDLSSNTTPIVEEKEVEELESKTLIENYLSENESTAEAEIETDEITFDETAVIYLDPCELSPSAETTSDPKEIHFVILPSISKPICTDQTPNDVPTLNLNSVLSLAGNTFDVNATTIAENDTSLSAETWDLSSLKLKSNRKKVRVEPYRNITWEDSNSGSSNSSFLDSSNVGSPVSSESSDSKEKAPKTKRRERKKSQNRNAATKYRQKKRAESEAIGSEERDLEDKNKKLHEQVNQLNNEIGYLKGLMREMLAAKGLINKK